MNKTDITTLLRALVKYNASDLHLKAGRPPLYRINGKLVPAKMPEFTPENVDELIRTFLSKKQLETLDKDKQVDLSFYVEEYGRFRCNVYYQRATISAAIRLIPSTAPKFQTLGLPEVLLDLCSKQRGLLLITGSTGTGKSTTLAAMVQYLNENRACHILLLEDPIEFTFTDLKASITQREIGTDAPSFHEALYAGLRQDPDVIVIGEMRDRATVQAALTAAETGHLVISTLHTNDAKSSIERILDVFPADQQSQIRVQLASTLIGVVSQQLILRQDRSGRALAAEVLVKSPACEDYIRANDITRIPEVIANSNAYYKMQSLNKALETMIRSGTIALQDALKASNNPDELRMKISGITRDEGYETKVA